MVRNTHQGYFGHTISLRRLMVAFLTVVNFHMVRMMLKYLRYFTYGMAILKRYSRSMGVSQLHSSTGVTILFF